MKLEILGSVALITPMDAEERQWISDNVEYESWQWYAGSLAVEPRFAEAIVDTYGYVTSLQLNKRTKS